VLRVQMFEAKQREKARRQQRKEEREARRAEERPAWIKMMQRELPECVEFRPTEEEFADPIRYIKAISHLGAPHGACKIIPPPSFRPDRVLSTPVVRTKLQTLLHQVQFEDGGTAFQTSHKKDYRTYTLEEYQKLGAKRFKEVFGEECPGESVIETEFWHTMSAAQNFSVQYANDVEGTACGDAFGPWNLAGIAKNSLLSLVDDNIPGVNTPMLYVGILFAHFCWHYEDNALFSINYMHEGSPKIWYTVPGEHSGGLEAAVKEAFSSHPDRQHPMMKDTEKLLMRKTVMCAPSVLMARGVPVYRCVQRPREFVVTFPRGYHSGFNTGFHLGEAVNFAMANWIPYGFLSLQRYRASGSMSCLDMERVLMRASEILSRGVDETLWCYEEVRTTSNIMALVVDWMERLCTWAFKRGWAIIEADRPWVEDPHFLDRQLCGACNHICHLCYVQPPGNRNEVFRFCTEHAGFLGKGPKEMCLRYTLEDLQSRALDLQRAVCEFGKASERSDHVTCTRDVCCQGAQLPLRQAESVPSIKYQDAMEIAKEEDGTGAAPSEAATPAGTLSPKVEDEEVEGLCKGVEMRQSDYVVRGIGGGIMTTGPKRVHSRFSQDLGVTQEIIPLSPFYFVDKFPMVEDLLQKDTSKSLALFRRCLLEEKPAIAHTVPALASLVVEQALRENLAYVASFMPRMYDPGPYKGSKWRCAEIVADEQHGTLRLRVCRERQGELSCKSSPVIKASIRGNASPEPLSRSHISSPEPSISCEKLKGTPLPQEAVALLPQEAVASLVRLDTPNAPAHESRAKGTLVQHSPKRRVLQGVPYDCAGLNAELEPVAKRQRASPDPADPSPPIRVKPASLSLKFPDVPKVQKRSTTPTEPIE